MDIEQTDNKPIIIPGNVVTGNVATPRTNSRTHYGVIMGAVFTMGSAVGAGICFKTGQLFNSIAAMVNGGTGVVGLVITSILLVMVGLLAFAACLGILNKYNAHRDLGVLGWLKSINGEKMYKSFRRFMLWVYIPASMVFLSYYVIQSLQDAIGEFSYGNESYTHLPPAALVACVAAVIIYAAVVGISPLVTGIHTTLISFVKFLPILMIVIGGIIIFNMNSEIREENWDSYNYADYELAVSPFTKISHLGLFACMPALFFTFDGFYAPTHTFEQMNKPRRGPLAVSIGVIMIALVNILIIVGLYIGSNGQNNTLAMDLPHWLKGTFMLLISIGVFGIVIGIAILGTSTYKKIYNKIFRLKIATKKTHMLLFTIIVYMAVFGITTCLGFLYRSPAFYDTFDELHPYPQSFKNMLEFMDIMSNGITATMFLFFVPPLYRLIKKHAHEEKKYFKILAIVAICFLVLPSSYMSIETFFNFVYFMSINQQYAVEHRIISPNADISEYRIGQVVRLSSLLALTAVCTSGFYWHKITGLFNKDAEHSAAIV